MKEYLNFILSLCLACFLMAISFMVKINTIEKAVKNFPPAMQETSTPAVPASAVETETITLTVYHPVESQCDFTPNVTADGTVINFKELKEGKIKYCAVSRDLLTRFPYGSTIYVKGHGEYKVVDTMNKRFEKYVDLLQDPSEPVFKKEGVLIIRLD